MVSFNAAHGPAERGRWATCPQSLTSAVAFASELVWFTFNRDKPADSCGHRPMQRQVMATADEPVASTRRSNVATPLAAVVCNCSRQAGWPGRQPRLLTGAARWRSARRKAGGRQERQASGSGRGERRRAASRQEQESGGWRGDQRRLACGTGNGDGYV